MQQLFPGEVFANTADFDTGIRQLLPRYDEMLEVITRCLPSTTLRVLELGCGTGELSLKILQRCPNAQVIALDYSPRMLQFAQSKIVTAGYQNRWSCVQADFGEWANNPEKFAAGKEFDACVSSLAIHHLQDEMKFKLFQQIAASLSPNGCFWNADPILPESPALVEVYKAAREEWANQQGKTLAEVRAKVGTTTTQGYSSQDQLASVDAHLQMLRQAGFLTVAVPWKYYGLAVFGGWLGKF
ncbi:MULTISPECIES: class I SAM-dependent methyltransferase [unclassified Tolypothrix]|uniref:class I SAM-dependent methyltransferase n=1 Tax=unclassified Tolypothrix TaxID=2649714 RepID=UPI0005EAC4DF|nr:MULTISPECIES: class I SAM-dependent methyltransferase [unclassified Tolypothrix]BAY89262.1 type 12 methyltransferase [Microchaete diplosiphon NIES-3275]EKE97749.1 SAM-dependent methyltransferase [Tolypothrix sp. PCC 7601]MBE9082263.1 class I SAM-dependent methyltransferase [Tolypothrix sp. LEGE 11397]UYD23550.1 class I SAM-dependent methyltransferase [Tolypothrix sp. PCC 7712]UYD34222.1 class I SAM-dependent methyltransferase [Tolypothrix sp. PCC 7601]